MADLPSPIDARDLQGLMAQIQKLMEDLYQDRIGGSYIGDVFASDADDVLTLSIGNGLEKTSNVLLVKLSSTGGLQFASGAVGVKCKAGGGLATSVDGLEVSGASTWAFKTINCPDGTDPVADQAADTLNLAAGNGLTITGNETTDTVTFAVKQQLHEADVAAVSAISAASGADSIDRAALNTALGTLVTEVNALKTKINNILSKLESAEILAAS